MNQFIQIAAILAVILITYIGLLAFGPPRKKLLYTKDERVQWESLIRRTFGSWLTATNIVGTLTSFATVFLFFLGNVPIFGWVLFVCCITIWTGAFATNALTERICQNDHIQSLLRSPDQTGGVIASLFWDNRRPAQASSAWVKYLSLANISAVIWLEFALLADVGGLLLGMDQLWQRALLLALSALAVFYFVLRFGLRGFVFTDIFQTPMIVVAVLTLLTGAGIALVVLSPTLTLTEAATPSAAPSTLVLFAFHVMFLNTFLVVVTEPHWLRVWIFGEKETKLQARSTGGAAVVWALLILTGFVARAFDPATLGEGAIVTLMEVTSRISPLFLIFFWLAGMAALFTTADANVYSFLLVAGFDSRTGRLRQRLLEAIRPAISSLSAAVLFALLYWVVRSVGLPFEKIIFLVIPLGLNLLPGLVSLAHRKRSGPFWMVTSLLVYLSSSVMGFRQSDNELLWTLSASLFPVLISSLLWTYYRRKGKNNAE